MASPVMGPEELCDSGFSDKDPSRFDVHDNYLPYHMDITVWTKLTNLSKDKHGPVIIGRQYGEAKASAKTIDAELLCSEGGADLILARLDKAYAVDTENQIDHELAAFLDYSWSKEVSVEYFISGFHMSVDKNAELNINNKLKGHLLLRQANFEENARHTILGASSGNYDVPSITSALRNVFQTSSPADATQYLHAPESSHTSQSGAASNKRDKCKQKCQSNNEGRRTSRKGNIFYPDSSPAPAIFNHDAHLPDYSYNTAYSSSSARSVIDPGACASIVRKKSLHKAMRALGVNTLPEASARRTNHLLGEYKEGRSTLFAIKMPFRSKLENGQVGVEFQIVFDVVEGEIPFLIGFPSIKAMKAISNFEYMDIAFRLNGKYCRLDLVEDNHHVHLPFTSVDGTPCIVIYF